jgi:CRISPR/Cas system type I-B associated protein Csh2 (Cas7 group RAMP superfamily)
MPFFINPNYAYKTGCSVKDVELLKILIPCAYDQTKSAIRPDVRMRHAWFIEHKNSLGSCPDYLLFEALTPKRKGDALEPSVSWNDYEDVKALPKALAEKIGSCVDLMGV